MKFSNWQIFSIVLGAVLVIYFVMSGIVASKYLADIENTAEVNGGVSDADVKRILGRY